MLIEFIGAAGSGKSFLTTKVLESLVARGLTAHNFDEIAINKLSIANLSLGVNAIRLGCLTKPRTIRALVRAVKVIARYSIRRQLCAKRTGIFVTSEGIFHRTITLQRNSRSKSLSQIAELLLNDIGPPDVVVLTEAKAETVFRRRTNRDRPNDLFDQESVRADIAVARESIEYIKEMKGRRKSRITVVKVRTDEEGAGPAVAEIVDLIGSAYGVCPRGQQ